MASVAVGLLFVACGLAFYAVHRFALYADDRGWVYYRTKSKRPTPWLGSLEGIYQPSVQHVVDEIASEEVRPEQDESGAGSPSDEAETPAEPSA